MHVAAHATWYPLSGDFRRLNAQCGFGGLGDERAITAREPWEPRDRVADHDDREALAACTRQLAIHEDVVDLACPPHPDRMNPVALHKIARNQSRVYDFRSVEHRDRETIRHRRIRRGDRRSLELEPGSLDYCAT